jgi:phosphatidylinositol alpha-1,6-mannosyltransferase
MKILYLTPGVFDKGGISRYNRHQIKCIRKRFGNNSVKVISLRGPGNTKFEFEGRPFDVYWSGKNSFASKIAFSIRSLYEAIIWKPDIVLTAHVNFSLLGVHCGRLAKAKTILNVYGLELWSNLLFHRQFGLENHHHILSDCYNTADYINNYFNFQRQIDIVWDPVDLDLFFPEKKHSGQFLEFGIPFSKDNFYLLTLCRLSKGSRHKGVERNIRMMKNIPDENIHYLIAGDGDDRARLEKISKNLGLAKRVHFLGSIPEDKMRSVYNMGDLFILISDFGVGRGEGIPMTPMEAGACGLPIFVGNQDGSRELIKNGQGGFLFSPNEQQKIIKSICLLKNNPKTYARLSAEIVDRMKDAFSLKRFHTETTTILEDLCQ